ncbi:MAG TPA: hypothetical protein VM512_01180, partial [Burkholderiaceae bacterium]|nr:hypothetical protein [Burkholderiaceae bacterium]
INDCVSVFTGTESTVDAPALQQVYRDFPFRQQRLMVFLPDERYSSSLIVDERWLQKPPQKEKLHIYRRACLGQMVRGPRCEPLSRIQFVPRA